MSFAPKLTRLVDKIEQASNPLSNQPENRHTDVWGETESEPVDIALTPVLLLIVGVTAFLTLVYVSGPNADRTRLVAGIALGFTLLTGFICYLRSRGRGVSQ